jgi:ketosteroid isomerase-like protein
MSQENVEIVRKFVVEFMVDEHDEGLTYLDADFVWNPVEASSTRGVDGFVATMARWESTWAEYEATAEEFVDMGDRVVATVRFHGRGRGSGVETDARYYEVYTVRDGKIVRMDEFTERSEALEAAGLRE